MYLRKVVPTRHGDILMGTCYSIFQKCIRRCLPEEALYYGILIKKYGSENALRKRLMLCVLEDMAHIEFVKTIFKTKDLERCIVIASYNKKTHISAWAQRVSLTPISVSLTPTSVSLTPTSVSLTPTSVSLTPTSVLTSVLTNELKELMEFSDLDVAKQYKTIRNKLCGMLAHIYTATGRSRLVFTCAVLSKYRPELNYELEEYKCQPRAFVEIPKWACDKHTAGGVAGFDYFYNYGLVMNNRIYDKPEDYEVEAYKLYKRAERISGKQHKTQHMIEFLRGVPDIDWQHPDRHLINDLHTLGFSRIIQVQLNTRKHAPTVFFAERGAQQYVVKGHLNENMKSAIILSEELKIKLGLYLKCEIVDDWAVWTCPFVYENEVTMCESKIETARPIYSGRNINCQFDIVNHFMAIFKAHLVKVLIGAGDYAKRNYIQVGDVVYSIDDHRTHNFDVITESMLYPNLKAVERSVWLEGIKNNKPHIVDMLKVWSQHLNDRCNQCIKLIEEI